MRKFFALLIVIGITGSLFISSSQTYEQQSLIPTLENLLPSKPFEDELSKLSIPYWDSTISVEERGYYLFIEFLLRKSAHFVLFGLLAAVIFLSLPSRFPRFITAFSITLLIAGADETHQYFTGGRTATIRDVILDMSGALFFLLLAQSVSLIRSRKKERLF
ncbi:VanZ family protein [Sporosarcina sp. P26b]|uniref:VanZ family protein n=1 Tax=Sporosarcina sp. P26b TaxID=2048253 RepID=UPI000C16E6C5|nr:VanZ family protein [Sporosarcina sp. P26b]PIC95691.1 VanZ family protein [Sporosarcina sp. P26b]